MKISAIRSDKVYSKIMNAPLDKKNDIYRYELMKPFEKKWACYSVPMKALTPNGYDVIMASEMLGHIAPTAVDQKQQNNIKLISDNTLWEKCELSIQQSLNCFVEHGVNLPIKEYAFTILLANAKNPYIILNDGYCGDGGCIFRKNCASVPEERSAIPLQTEQNSAGRLITIGYSAIPARKFKAICLRCHST